MKIKIFLLFIFCISSSISFSDEVTFDEWLVSFKNDALDQGISNNTLEKYNFLTINQKKYLFIS